MELNFTNVLLGCSLILFICTSFLVHARKPVVYLFAHGIADSKDQVNRYVKSYINPKNPNQMIFNDRYVISGPVESFDFPDAQGPIARLARIDFTQTSLGQDNELKALKDAYDKTLNSYPDHDVVLVGMSRGASTIINFLGKYADETKRVKAAILESPFDSIPALINDAIKGKKTQDIAHGVFSKRIPFFKYDHAGKQPIDWVSKIRKNLPVLLVSSLKDSRVPTESTARLYTKFRNLGHKKTHFLIVNSGSHSKLLTSDDGETYQNTAHAFSHKYKLPHDRKLAKAGYSTLAKTTPTIPIEINRSNS